ncbi:hypothetical protein GGS20DRAFT_91777 [Poronia punctata]|nr:hypothetical protein GGS20DRAFT_91777 [Poronia punctata]
MNISTYRVLLLSILGFSFFFFFAFAFSLMPVKNFLPRDSLSSVRGGFRLPPRPTTSSLRIRVKFTRSAKNLRDVISTSTPTDIVQSPDMIIAITEWTAYHVCFIFRNRGSEVLQRSGGLTRPQSESLPNAVGTQEHMQGSG